MEFWKKFYFLQKLTNETNIQEMKKQLEYWSKKSDGDKRSPLKYIMEKEEIIKM